MLINVHQELLDFAGKPLTYRESEEDDPVNMTAGDAIMLSLTNGIERKPDAKESGRDKYRRFDVCMRCQAANNSEKGEISLTSEEVTLIKDSAALVLPVITYGRLIQIIEPDEKVS